MTQGEVISKLTRECCLALGDFDHYQTVRTYIQMALMVGIEHFSVTMEEIVALYKDGTEAGRFKSVTETALKLGIEETNIVAVLNGRKHTAGGLVFVRSKDYELVPRNNEEKIPLRLF